VLAGGEVLIVPYDSLSGSEIYDPATGTFNLTGALGYFLGVPHRTLLLNGAILFTGGSDGFGNVNRAKLYDPAAGIFASNGSMSTPREDHSATLLPDGTVLVAGGAGQSGCMQPPVAGAEIYDPATSGFSTTGSLASARIAHTATLLNNGQVLTARPGAVFRRRSRLSRLLPGELPFAEWSGIRASGRPAPDLPRPIQQ
jgi:hypothetical protein